MKKFLLLFAAAAVALGAAASGYSKGKDIRPSANMKTIKVKEATANHAPKQVIEEQPAGEAKNYLQYTEGLYPDYYIYSGANSFSGSIVFAEDGSTVYIKNILPNIASYWNEGDYWVEGQLSADGKKISVPLGQEIYSDSYYGTIVLAWGKTSVDEENYIVFEPIEGKEAAEFSINEDGTITLDGGQGDINAEEMDAFVGEGLAGAFLEEDGLSFAGESSWIIKFTDMENIKPAKPANPTITKWYDSGSQDGFSKLTFSIPLEDVDGNALNPGNVSFSIFTDDDELFVFTQEEYGGYNSLMADGDVTEIPYGYYDYDFSTTGVYFYRTNAEGYEPLFERRIGIQVYNTMNGERKASKIVYWPAEENDDDFFVMGAFSGWLDAPVPFEDNGAGILEATIDLSGEEGDLEFKIACPDANASADDNGYKWFGGVDENQVGFFYVGDNLLDVPLSLVSPGSNFRMAEAGNYTIQLVSNNNESDGAGGAPRKFKASDNLQIVVSKNEATAVRDLNMDNAASVHYVNLAGQVSATPFAGVNIEVITMKDGSKRAVKVIK